MINYNNQYPNLIKYMGSKSKILDFVIEGISQVHTDGQYIVDLFAGSATLSGALRGHHPVISNDIQTYSAALANAYLADYDWENYPNLINDIIEIATNHYNEYKLLHYSDFNFDYSSISNIDDFKFLEKKQQNLIDHTDWPDSYYLFTKNYSGTYWSFDQCVWIDSYKYAADQYANTPYYNLILTSLMYAMSYNAQSTGHYAQYRDAGSESSMRDILMYRNKTITPFFQRKMQELQSFLGHSSYEFNTMAADYRECLSQIPEGATVYADPPYCFVHYSRFYHVLETLVRYDYPEVRFKGRYRTDRHQSPFCIKTQVEGAFRDMFLGIESRNANLALSYSNTGMITLERIEEIAQEILPNYHISHLITDYTHSTMGRREDKSREVKEAIILAKKIQEQG